MGFWGIPINIAVVPTNPIDTDVSTRDTIHQMIAIARVSAHCPAVTVLLDKLLRSLPKNPTNMDLVRAIFWWVKNNVKFEEDETILGNQLGWEDVNQELLITPQTLLSMQVPMGDCDDFSMLVASLLIAASIPAWFVTVAVDRAEPTRFSHVYVKALVDGRGVYLDASHGACPGWETGREKFRKVEWPV